MIHLMKWRMLNFYGCDDYTGSAYYEPSYVLTRCYWAGSFN